MKPSNDQEAIFLILDGLREQGVTTYAVNDGEEVIEVASVSDAVEAITAVDMATAYVTRPDGGDSFIWFVLGNDPEEVAADYGVSLEKYLDPIVRPWWGF